MKVEWPIQTERLLLRPFEEADVEAVWSFERLPQVQQWLGWAPGSCEELSVALDPAASATTHVVVILDRSLIGHVMIMPRDSWAQWNVPERPVGTEAELGWMFDPDWSGKGYATEAVRAVIDYCFAGLGLRRVFAGCFAVNTASSRLMERVGMRLEQHGRKTSLHSDGTWYDNLSYALLNEEWDMR